MPNKYGQITKADFVAPAGKFRIIREDTRDGELSISMDAIETESLALDLLRCARQGTDLYCVCGIFTLCGDAGVINQ